MVVSQHDPQESYLWEDSNLYKAVWGLHSQKKKSKPRIYLRASCENPEIMIHKGNSPLLNNGHYIGQHCAEQEKHDCARAKGNLQATSVQTLS